ncbi:MAG: hypothetical protein OEU40_12635 [Gammaproteobacteria bacterium]|jgi:hypothetical protein|nr:hypothetical protein [Gammaproteobacteria bacterium]
MLRIWSAFVLCLVVGACSQQRTLDKTIPSYQGAMPADFSGSWERDYSRGDDVNGVLSGIFFQLNRRAEQRFPDNSRMGNPQPGISQREASSIVALARMAELITRPDILTIAQNEHEISIARKGDFSMLCEFYGGVAKGTTSDYGAEVCGWDGNQLVSHLILPDGLNVIHRFTLSPDGNNMRVTTTVSSSTTRVPFTLNRFYMKFERPASEFNCIWTLSMKRVCSTGEIVP